ncbi:MAG: DUF222 domain-containing protein, partial [Candidatus Rokuibacteriota bacterium]
YQRRREQTPDADAPTMEQQQADALALLAETALHHGVDPGAPGERYQVVVHVDAAVLADAEAPGQSVLEDGVRVPAGTSQRLACDARRVVMRHDADGRLLEVGARTRTIDVLYPLACGSWRAPFGDRVRVGDGRVAGQTLGKITSGTP